MAAAASRSEHHLIITRSGSPRDAPEVLLVREADGWALPCIESEERRSADVTPLNRSVRERLGVEISVLRCLRDGPADANSIRRQVYEAESHADRSSPPAVGAWLGLATLDATPLVVPAQRPVLQAWLDDRRVRSLSVEQGEWELSGWRDRVTAWALAAVRRQRATRILEIEQLRVWEFSCVLRLGTDAGDLYLKALPRSTSTETRLTRRLAETHPRWTAPVVAIEPERGWILTRAVRGPALMGVRDLARWTQAADACARIQIDWRNERQSSRRSAVHRGASNGWRPRSGRSWRTRAPCSRATRKGSTRARSSGYVSAGPRSRRRAESSPGTGFPPPSSTAICGAKTSSSLPTARCSSTGRMPPSPIRSSARHFCS